MPALKTPFGDFKGRAGDGIIQYLGIKYATLTNQLSTPELVHSYGTQLIDATSYGPQAPAMDGCEFEQNVLIQQSIGVPYSPPPMSGTSCLNLNITVPDTLQPSSKALPVMVFIHGGGFIMGSNYWPQYDLGRLVKLSVELEMPIIAININYRLAVLGNLTSTELRAAGYPGNNSLRDQQCALKWIKAHIGGFGGDPENVTAFGESAGGGAAVLSHLFSEESLFKRTISMSGTPIMLKPLSHAASEEAYEGVMKAFGLENASVEERIEHLQNMTPEELVRLTPMSIPLVPFMDGDIITAMTSFKGLAKSDEDLKAEVPGRKWCEGLMIGDCQHDGTVYFYMGLAERKDGIASALHMSLTNSLDKAVAGAVLEAYNISPTTADDEAMKSILKLATDIAYCAPALAYARSFPGKTYYYQFDEPNLWNGVFKGYATHGLDLVFLLQNFSEKLGEREKHFGKHFAKGFVSFAHGLEPWKGFEGKDGEVKTFGTGNTASGLEGRRDVLFRLQKEGKVNLDSLSVAWDIFVGGKY